MPPLLATRQDVYDMLDRFDNMTSEQIRDYFEENGISSSGVIDYARLVCSAALSMGGPANDQEALTLMLALFSGGVVLGLKLAEMAAQNEVVEDSRR